MSYHQLLAARGRERRDDKTRGLTHNGTFGSSWPNIQPLYNHHKIMLIIISFFFPLLAFLAGRYTSKILARQRKSIEKITIFPTRMGKVVMHRAAINRASGGLGLWRSGCGRARAFIIKIRAGSGSESRAAGSNVPSVPLSLNSQGLMRSPQKGV